MLYYRSPSNRVTYYPSSQFVLGIINCSDDLFWHATTKVLHCSFLWAGGFLVQVPKSSCVGTFLSLVFLFLALCKFYSSHGKCGVAPFSATPKQISSNICYGGVIAIRNRCDLPLVFQQMAVQQLCVFIEGYFCSTLMNIPFPFIETGTDKPSRSLVCLKYERNFINCWNNICYLVLD